MRRLILFFMFFCLFFSFANPVKAQTSGKDLYKVGINDVLEIKVLDHDELRTLATVTADGSITFPYLGTVYVKDKSLSEIEKEITKTLDKGYIKYPVVSVSLITSISEKIYVYGELLKRGEVLFRENMTIVKALSLAGGISNDGLYGKVKIRRKQEGEPGYKDIEIDLKGTIEGSVTEDMLLQPDDILIVERNKTFLIQGEVASRGRFMLEKDMTVLRALLEAGGVNDNGLYGKVKVRRKQEGELGEYKDIVEAKLNDGVIESKEVEDMLLQPDDILIVERNKVFFIYGEVNRPGQYVLENDMTVFKAITLSGGFTKWGSSSGIKVLRKTEDRTGFTSININIKDIIKGDASADINLLSGDIVVVSTGIF